VVSALHVQVPLRISFGGGGTDVDTYYAAHGGVVVSTAIATYCHVSVGRMESGVEVTATDYDATVRCSRAAELPLEAPFLLAHAALTELWPAEAGGIRVTLGADVAPGSGMGTSCALVVALCAALGALLGKELSGAALAELAYRVDHEVAGLPSGKQDHYAAACGGLNVIEFRGDGVTVTPVGLRERCSSSTALRALPPRCSSGSAPPRSLPGPCSRHCTM
jgi:D-glycero-alpha-D-manno-heptose-7-phosphate kinase